MLSVANWFDLQNVTSIGLKDETGFVVTPVRQTAPTAILLVKNAMHFEIQIDRYSFIGKNRWWPR